MEEVRSKSQSNDVYRRLVHVRSGNRIREGRKVRNRCRDRRHRHQERRGKSRRGDPPGGPPDRPQHQDYLVAEEEEGREGQEGQEKAEIDRRDPYLISRSACSRIGWGIAVPSAAAVLRLITSSKTIGCSTGRSAGRVPRRILST